MPLLSRAGQSLGIYGGKIVNGWPLIVRNVGPLFRRFVFDRFRGTDSYLYNYDPVGNVTAVTLNVVPASGSVSLAFSAQSGTTNVPLVPALAMMVSETVVGASLTP